MKAKYLFIGLFAAALSSCSEDRLFQDPATSFSDETVLESVESANTVLMGAYYYTAHYHYHTIGNLCMDVMGDDLKVTDGSYGLSTYNWIMFAYNYTQYPRVVDGWWSAYAPYMWRQAYHAIDQCNELINYAENLPSSTASDEAQSKSILAQAYAIRGYNFLNLFHLFCGSYTGQGASGQGLFLRTTPGSAQSENDVPRSNLGESFQQIISDFTNAYNNLSDDRSNSLYINKDAAALLLARAYLEMGDYANAQKYAETLTNFDGSDLMSQAEWQSGFNTANKEYLWGFNFTSETTNIYASMYSFLQFATAKDANSTFGTEGYGSQTDYDYIYDNGLDVLEGYSTIRANNSFVELFGDGDCRKLFPFYFDEKDGYFIAKFTSKNTSSLGVGDWPMLRLAEAYLIEAEACLQNGQTAKGLAALNALQAQRGGTISTELNIDEVWKERRRELYGEGFALGDLKRLQKPLERTGIDHWSSTLSLPANSPRMMFPIPLDELDYNANATSADQNEYWR